MVFQVVADVQKITLYSDIDSYIEDIEELKREWILELLESFGFTEEEINEEN